MKGRDLGSVAAEIEEKLARFTSTTSITRSFWANMRPGRSPRRLLLLSAYGHGGHRADPVRRLSILR